MIIHSLLIVILILIVTIKCSNKILIISEGDEESSRIIKMIHEQSQKQQQQLYKIEEVNTNDKIPKIISSIDDEPLYHTIYYLKSSWNSLSTIDVVNFVKNGGNFFTTSGDKNLLNEFGMEIIEGNFIGSLKGQWNKRHSFYNFIINDDDDVNNRVNDDDVNNVNLPIGKNLSFKLKNDPKINNFNPLIQSSIHFTSNSGICSNENNQKCYSNSQNISLFSTLESRKGSRFAIISSLKLFNSFPEKVIKGIIEWIQKLKFNIKISSISHELLFDNNFISPNRGKTELSSTIYRVKDRINVRMCLIDANTNERFIPSDSSDFQFELKMMNIQLRKSFDTIDSDGCLNVKNIQLPSKPAIYTLQINYNRPGWSQLHHNERLLVRPYRHDEFPRFLNVAIPYYLSWLGLLVASYMILLPSLFKQLK